MTICAICGNNKATTRDHVPPKGIFPKPRPDLITVPACSVCNNGDSALDDLFKVFLSFQAVDKSEIGSRLFHEKTLRTLNFNKKLLNYIKNESKDIETTNQDGVLVSATGVLWDSNAHDQVISRTIKGLYYHHFGSPLPSDTILNVHWLKKVPVKIEERLHLFTTEVIGENQVIYKYFIDKKNPKYSTWIFEFYGAHWASGYSIPS